MGKDQDSIQSSTKPDPGYQWASDNFTIRHHKESKEVSQAIMTLHFLNDVANDAESTQNLKIIASCQSETIGKLINRIQGPRLLMSSLPGSALRMHVKSLGKPRDVNKRSHSLSW